MAFRFQIRSEGALVGSAEGVGYASALSAFLGVPVHWPVLISMSCGQNARTYAHQGREYTVTLDRGPR